MENLKYIEAGLRAAETVRISPRKIWMILEIAAQLSANENVGIKEMVELRLEADRLFDADGNLKPETEEKSEAAGSPEQKTGFAFGATRIPPKYGDEYWSIYKNEPSQYQWNEDEYDWEWLEKGEVFLYPTDCQQYVNYLNSLTDGHS